MPAGRNFSHDGRRALPRAGEVLEVGAAAIENRLRQRAALVDVEERLVLRIVREHRRADAGPFPPGPRARSGRASLSDWRSATTSADDHCGVSATPFAVTVSRPAKQPRDGRRLLRRDRRIEQPLGRLDVQIVREVEDVRDERALDRVRLEAEVDVAERHRVRRRRGAARQPMDTTEDRRAREATQRSSLCGLRELCVPVSGVVTAGNGNVRPWRSRRARFTCAGYLSVADQRALVGPVPRARRRRRAGLRADRARRRQDARPHAVPRPPLEREDVPLRDAPHRLRRPAGAAAARRLRAAGARHRAGGRHDARRRPLHPELLRRRRPDGAAPGQGRERASLAAGLPVVSVSLGDTARFLFGGLRRRIRSRRGCWSQATRSSSAVRRACAITACRASCPDTAPPELELAGRFNLTFRQYGSDRIENAADERGRGEAADPRRSAARSRPSTAGSGRIMRAGRSPPARRGTPRRRSRYTTHAC